MTMKLMRVLIISILAPAALAVADDRPANAFDKTAYGYLKAVILRSAEKMPEEGYAFKPTEAVRSFGQVLGHVADAQYMFCSMVLGEKNPEMKIEKTKSSKADLTASLKDAFAYCDKAYERTADSAFAGQMIKFHSMDMTRAEALRANNMHTVEHYGNIITYLRLKNIVPPSSDPEFKVQP